MLIYLSFEREEMAADALKDEERAKQIAFGDARRKRNQRDHGGVDDDSDDEENDGFRQRKKAKKERTDIKGLGKCSSLFSVVFMC